MAFAMAWNVLGQTMILSVDPLSPTAFSSPTAEYLTFRLRLENASSTPITQIQGLTLYVTVTGGTAGSLPKVYDVNLLGPWPGSTALGVFNNTPLPGTSIVPWEYLGDSVSVQNSSEVSVDVMTTTAADNSGYAGLTIAANSGPTFLGEVTLKRAVGDQGPWTVKMFMPDTLLVASELSAMTNVDPFVATYSLNPLEFGVSVVPEPEEMAMAFGVVLVGVGVWRRSKRGSAVSQK